MSGSPLDGLKWWQRALLHLALLAVTAWNGIREWWR